MTDGSSAFDDLILHAKSQDIDLIRFCLSDQVSLRLTNVLEESMDPVLYAREIMKRHYQTIHDKFFLDLFNGRNVPTAIVRSLVFDCIVSAALTVRAATVRPGSIEGARGLTAQARTFLLCKKDSYTDDMCFSGLGDFRAIADGFFEYHNDQLMSRDTYLLGPLISGVSSANRSDWILYDRNWQKTLLDHPKRTQSFRMFLHASVSSYVIPDRALPELFHLTREDILSFMYSFAELRKDRKAKLSEIRNFVIRLGMYFDLLSINDFFTYMLERPFGIFEHYHNSSFGNTFQIKSSVPSQ